MGTLVAILVLFNVVEAEAERRSGDEMDVDIEEDETRKLLALLGRS